MADYGNLGTIAQIRGDLEQAEELYRKSLQINEQLGHLEGMAADYGNLGIIALRGDFRRKNCIGNSRSTSSWGIGRGWRGPTGTWALSSRLSSYDRRARALYFDIGITGEVDELDRALSELENKESTK